MYDKSLHHAVPVCSHRFYSPAFLVLAAFPIAVWAQTTTTDKNAAYNPGDIVALDTFVVSVEKDTGYIASDSLVGGRISTNLLKTPSDVSVLTREFLDDIAVDDYHDAARWLTGTVTVPSGINQQDFGADVQFRGLAFTGSYPSRNYFRYNNSVDGYIVDRLEGSRGPNALLFGDGVVSGVLNTLTKRARPGSSITEIQTRFDGENSWRFSVDVNRSLGKQFAVRVNLVDMDQRTWIRNTFNVRRGAQVALTWRPWKGGEFRAELEWMHSRTSYAPLFFTDAASSWDRVTVFNGPQATNPASSTGLSRQTVDKLVFGPSYLNIGVQNVKNFGFTNGTQLSILPTARDLGLANFPALARDFTAQPKDAWHQSNYRVAGAYYTQQIGNDFSFELATQRAWSPHYKSYNARFTNYQIDVNTLLPNGDANPNFGKPYTDQQYLRTYRQDNRHTDFRLAAVYTLPIRSFTQRFNVLMTSREELFDFYQTRLVRTNGTVADLSNAANQINIRRYFDEASDVTILPTEGVNGISLGELITQDRFQKQNLDTIQVSAIGEYWKERISLIAGTRWDKYSNSSRALGTKLSNGQPNPDGYTTAGIDVKTQRNSVGLVFFPISQIGVYANYSESFNPANSGNILLDGSILQPTKAIGKTAGLRFKLMDGNVVGSIGYYNTFEHGRSSSYSLTEINRLWTNLNMSSNQIAGDNYSDTITAGGTGYEADFVANLTKNFRLRFNVALPDNIQKESVPQLRTYYAQNIALWQAAANDPANQFRVQIQKDIDALSTRLENAQEGRKINGLPDYIANFFANYTFTNGVLKACRIGGGVNLIGRNLIGNQAGLPYDYIYSDSYKLYTVTFGRSFSLGKTKCDVQLNVDNLLDYADPVYTGTTTYQGQALRSAYYYIAPRKFTLTTTLKF